MLKFIRTTIVGGILFLVPIVILVVILGKALGLARKLAAPIASRIPAESFIGVRVSMLIAITLIVLFCFLAGLIARTAIAGGFVRKLETSVLSHLPGYAFFKSTGESLLGVEEENAYPPVIVRLGHTTQIGFQLDRLENGMLAVFIPGAPQPYSGSVHFLPPDRVTPAQVPARVAMRCLKQLGAGADALKAGFPPPDQVASVDTGPRRP